MSQPTGKQVKRPRPTRPEPHDQRQALAWAGRRLAWERWLGGVHHRAGR